MKFEGKTLKELKKKEKKTFFFSIPLMFYLQVSSFLFINKTSKLRHRIEEQDYFKRIEINRSELSYEFFQYRATLLPNSCKRWEMSKIIEQNYGKLYEQNYGKLYNSYQDLNG